MINCNHSYNAQHLAIHCYTFRKYNALKQMTNNFLM